MNSLHSICYWFVGGCTAFCLLIALWVQSTSLLWMCVGLVISFGGLTVQRRALLRQQTAAGEQASPR